MHFDCNLKKKTGLIFNSDKNYIEKFFLKSKKHVSLHKEYQGNKWYLGRINKFNKNRFDNLKNKSNLGIIRLPFFKGVQYKFWKNFLNETRQIKKILDHYNFIWNKKGFHVPYHGDLTLSNIIFLKDNGIRFIDWEFFERKQPWGLDICNFFISLIVLPAKKKKKYVIDAADSLKFKNIWRLFFKNLNYEYLNNPIKFIKNKTRLSPENYLSKIPEQFEIKINLLIKDAN